MDAKKREVNYRKEVVKREKKDVKERSNKNLSSFQKKMRYVLLKIVLLRNEERNKNLHTKTPATLAFTDHKLRTWWCYRPWWACPGAWQSLGALQGRTASTIASQHSPHLECQQGLACDTPPQSEWVRMAGWRGINESDKWWSKPPKKTPPRKGQLPNIGHPSR